MFCGCEELSIERKFVVPSVFQNLVIYTVFIVLMVIHCRNVFNKSCKICSIYIEENVAVLLTATEMIYNKKSL